MRPLRILLAGLSCFGLAACAGGQGIIAVPQPSAGVNEVLTGPIAGAPGHSLVMGDLVMGPGGEIPRHIHAGEEFLYVLGGSAVVSRFGEPDLILRPGQGVRIAPGTVHWGRAGPEGVRAVASWVAVAGEPMRIEVPE